MIGTDLWILFLAGLLGGGHCVGMCGGIVTALTLSLPAEHSRWLILLGYNLGRISSYAMVGALLGGLAATGLALASTQHFQLGLAVLANLMLVAMGLYLAGLSTAITTLERLGRPIWRRLQFVMGRLLPVRSLTGAFLAGMVWGWLPCGLVYSASLSALATGNAGQGALTMLTFGLGTLPNLLLLGVFVDNLRQWMQKRFIRLVAGGAVTSLGVWRLLWLLNSMI